VAFSVDGPQVAFRGFSAKAHLMTLTSLFSVVLGLADCATEPQSPQSQNNTSQETTPSDQDSNSRSSSGSGSQ
jgi:hypothetical protein